MGKITALRPGRGREKRVTVFLDGKLAFSLDTAVVAKEGLRVEQVLSEERVETLVKADRLQRCFNAAVRYLAYRPRSESELRIKLKQHGFDVDTLETVLDRLKRQGAVDDMAFAQFWKDDRESFSPRSEVLTRLELRRKGVGEAILDQVVGTLDDEDGAYRAGLAKARSIAHLDFQNFRRRLGGHLRRRGFSYEVIDRVVDRVWQDQRGQVPTSYGSPVKVENEVSK